MIRTQLSARVLGLLLGLQLGFAHLAPAPLRAQDEDDDRPAPRAKGPTIPGRNEVLCKAFEDVAKKASASVVSVGGAAYGVVLEGGVIVTTADAAKGPARIRVKGAGVTGEARVLGVDEERGIGVLEAPDGASPLALADAGSLSIGQFVISVGTEPRPLAAGVLSARDRRVEPKDISQGNILMGLMSDDLTGPKRSFAKVLQHDSPMSEETLGSPLVDSSGKLVGLNVGTGYRGSSYALASEDLLAAVKAIKEGKTLPSERPTTRKKERPIEAPKDEPSESPEPKKERRTSEAKPGARPYLGCSIARDADGKLVVQDLVDGGPAHQAGLRPQDRILSFDGQKLASLDDLASALKERRAGDDVVVSVLRDGEKMKLKVKLGEKK